MSGALKPMDVGTEVTLVPTRVEGSFIQVETGCFNLSKPCAPKFIRAATLTCGLLASCARSSPIDGKYANSRRRNYHFCDQDHSRNGQIGIRLRSEVETISMSLSRIGRSRDGMLLVESARVLNGQFLRTLSRRPQGHFLSAAWLFDVTRSPDLVSLLRLTVG
jgi:hypothetical protein